MTVEQAISNILNDKRLLLTHSRVEFIRQIIAQYDEGQFNDTPRS